MTNLERQFRDHSSVTRSVAAARARKLTARGGSFTARRPVGRVLRTSADALDASPGADARGPCTSSARKHGRPPRTLGLRDVQPSASCLARGAGHQQLGRRGSKAGCHAGPRHGRRGADAPQAPRQRRGDTRWVWGPARRSCRRLPLRLPPACAAHRLGALARRAAFSPAAPPPPHCRPRRARNVCCRDHALTLCWFLGVFKAATLKTVAATAATAAVLSTASATMAAEPA